MWTLALACAFFVFIHLIVSGTDARAQIIKGIGRTAYRLLFALASLAGLVWMIIAFTVAQSDALNIAFWSTPFFLRILALVGNLLAFQLIVIGITSSSPTGMSSIKTLPDIPVYGIIRVTRHPVLAGIGLWALIHVITNADLASWIFFGSLLITAVMGAHSIDRKRKAAHGGEFEAVYRRTSIIPFAAILERRTVFIAGEIGFVRPFLALGLFCLIAVLHEMLFGVRAL